MKTYKIEFNDFKSIQLVGKLIKGDMFWWIKATGGETFYFRPENVNTLWAIPNEAKQ